MNYVLFAKMDKVFSLKKKQNLKNYSGKMGKKYWKSHGKSPRILSVGKSAQCELALADV